MFLYLFVLTRQEKIPLSEFVQNYRGNLSINFATLPLSHHGNIFTVPSLKQRFSLSIKNLQSSKTFEPFIRSYAFNSNFKLKITNSAFQNYQTTAILLNNENLNLNGQTYQDTTANSGFYDRSKTQDSVITISYCYFKNCNAVDSSSGTGSFTSGGALYFSSTTSVSITNTVFEGCSSYYKGGSIYIETSKGSTTIRECQFINSKSCFGTAIYIHNSQPADIRNVLFSGSTVDTAPEPNPKTGTILFSYTQATVQYCTFENSRFTTLPTGNYNYAEIFVVNSKLYDDEQNLQAQSLTFGGICAVYNGDIPSNDYQVVYYYKYASETVTTGQVQVNQAGITLYYLTETNKKVSTDTDISSCNTIYATPERTPTEFVPVPDPVPDPTQPPPQTAVPPSSGVAVPSQTVPPQTVVPQTPNNNNNNQNSGGLTRSQKITIAWVVPVVVVVIVLIVVIVYCLLKDRRTAFKPEEQAEDEEFAFPTV